MSSSSRNETFRRTNILFKNVDALKGFIIHDEDGASQSRRGGSVLRNLNEFKVRKLFGEAIYGAGLQSYLQGRVQDKRFSGDMLSGKVDESGRKWLSEKDTHFFEPTITLEGTRKIHTYGYCACDFGGEGSLCPHMAALMIAWVRKPEEFQERISEEDFESSKARVTASLKDLVDLVEKGESSKATDLELLQKTYSKLKLWTEEVREASKKEKSMSIEFSHTINYVSLALISAIETKYQIKAIDLYNKNTVSTFGKVLDSFSHSASKKKPIARKSRSRTARTWDKLLDDFR